MDGIIILDTDSINTDEYLSFSNSDGKKWSIPLKSISLGLELYEPSGYKGKLLKCFLPVISNTKIPHLLFKTANEHVTLDKNLRVLLQKCFGSDWEYSIFFGTPCIDQKVTIQIYRNKEILGYCKLGSSERVKTLFEHEKEVLELLNNCGVNHTPVCIALSKINDKAWAFVQSTEKRNRFKTDHTFSKKHDDFLCELYEKTSFRICFEETDYYKSLVSLEKNMDYIENKYQETVLLSMKKVIKKYSNKIVNWGLCHRDFTPWNTCSIDGKLFVFDFEYALFNGPKDIDAMHFFVQTNVFERHKNMYEIAQLFKKQNNDIFTFEEYLLDIISLYLLRGSEEDILIANQRAELLYWVTK